MRQWGHETMRHPYRLEKKLQKGSGFSKFLHAKASSKIYFKTRCLPYRASLCTGRQKTCCRGRSEQGRGSSAPETYNSATEYWDKSAAKATRKGKGPFCYPWTIPWRRKERGWVSSWSLCPFTHIPVLFHFKELLIMCSPMRGDGTYTSSEDFL